MNDKGKLTGRTCLLVLAGLALTVTGSLLAPPGKPYVWLLCGGWAAMAFAFTSVYLKARGVIREQQIRADERSQLSNPGGRR